MTERTLADVIVERLTTWGVGRVFGYSGDGINGFMGALRRTDGRVEFVQARHEESAPFMAVGHAKYTGGVGVVTSTQGPGAVHLLNGLYDAKLDGVPVVAIVGQQSRTVLGSAYMQEIDLNALFKDVASQFVQLVSAPEQVPMVLDRAFRTAKATSSPCVVIIPHDVQSAPAPELEQLHGIVVTAPSWSAAAKSPRGEDLAAAAALLNSAERVPSWWARVPGTPARKWLPWRKSLGPASPPASWASPTWMRTCPSRWEPWGIWAPRPVPTFWAIATPSS
ncbi:hypothetical protein StoSoilB19_07270 [Arthrobacter sp. StoSoilB19]|nr:hypothetical protein StoSoilB19_07270 [Arthrobacter sp. StoSoilB19]